MSKHYNLKNIRTLLTEGFTDEELRRLCYDLPDFRPVYDQIAQNTGKAGIIDRLIEYADRKLLIETLLTLTKEYSPARYEKHQPYYDWDPAISPEDSPKVSKVECQKCGTPNRSEARYCRGCGQPLSSEQHPVAPLAGDQIISGNYNVAIGSIHGSQVNIHVDKDQASPMAHEQIQKLRLFLEESFQTPAELKGFCLDYNLKVLPVLLPTDTPRDMVQKILEYCRQHSELDYLKQCLAKAKPKKYQQFYE